MKNILLVTFLLISLACFSQSRNEAAILRVLDEQTMAWNRGDIENFMQGYWKSDSLKFIGKSGITYGWTNTLNNYKKGYPDTTAMGKLTFTIINIERLSRKYFHVIGKWYLKRSIGDVGGHFTLLFRKIAGNWVIVLDHTS